MPGREELLLGVDPGRSKTGVALVRGDGTIMETRVILMDSFAAGLQAFVLGSAISVCVLGNGTTSASMEAVLKKLFPQVPLQVVNEAHSTEEARRLYWVVHPPTGWRKLLPLGLQVPPENLDGLAAAVLVRRYLKL